MWGRLRRSASADYGLTGAVGVGLPLVVGALTGDYAEGAWVGLGAYLLALAVPKGPYTLPARRVWATFAVIVVCAAAGVAVSAHLWWAVLVVPWVAAVGAVVPWIGITGPLTVLVAATQPGGQDLSHLVPAVGLGALWMALLMLLPFRRRVQRQLRATVADAARATAALLEEPGGGDDLRERAAREFAEARAALELTRPTERGLRRERLIDALVRVLHSAVTLHTLQKGMKDPPPEVHEAIVYQAARLRVLADAIENSLHLPSAQTATLTRLDERVDGVRARWRLERREGEETGQEYLDLFVLEQARRLLHRIGGSVETAVRLANGLTFERAHPALPTLPWPWADRAQPGGGRSRRSRELPGARLRADRAQPGDGRSQRSRELPSVRSRADRAQPGRGWRVALAHVGERSPTFRYATRLCVTTGVALAVVAAFEPEHGNWLAISAMVTTRATYGETLERARARIVGVLAGGVLAALVLQLVHAKLLLALVVFAFALLAFAFRDLGHTTWVLFVTPTMMTLVDFAAPLGWEVAALRVVLTIAGVLIALVAGRLLWPRGGLRVEERVRAVRRTHAELVRAMSAVLDLEPNDYKGAYRRARKAADELARARNRMAAEPAPDTERIGELKRILQTAQRVRDHMVTLRGLLPEETIDPGPVPGLLDTVADALEEGGAPDTGPQLGLLDAYLSDLAKARRAEVVAGRKGDTPLRRDLLHAAAVRSALRGLASESFGERDADEDE